MRPEDAADARVAAEVYPLAVKQARGQVLLQMAVMLLCVVLLVLARFPRRLAWTVGILTTGAVATAYDVRWWLWLRRADPVEGYRRLQARPTHEGGRFRAGLTLWIMMT